MSEKEKIQKLGAYIVKNEEQRATATTAKEIKALVERIKGKLIPRNSKNVSLSSRKDKSTSLAETRKVINTTAGSISIQKKPRNKLHSMEKLIAVKMKHKSIAEKQQTEKQRKMLENIRREEQLMNKRKKRQFYVKKQTKLVRDIENERNRERKDFLVRREEYKRVKLIEQIQNEDKRSSSLVKQRTELKKLRQEMRKNANYTKYQTKLELEKLALEFNVSYFAPRVEKHGRNSGDRSKENAGGSRIETGVANDELSRKKRCQ